MKDVMARSVPKRDHAVVHSISAFSWDVSSSAIAPATNEAPSANVQRQGKALRRNLPIKLSAQPPTARTTRRFGAVQQGGRRLRKQPQDESADVFLQRELPLQDLVHD
jgi:hypothetical protein